MPQLTVEIDAAGGEVRGQAPPAANLGVRLYSQGGDSFDLTARTDRQGDWSVDDSNLPPRAGFTIAEVTRAEARLTVDNGHLVIAIAGAPIGPTPVPSPTPDGIHAKIYLPFATKK